MALIKGSMSINEYTNAFIDEMKFAMWLVLYELTKIDMYAKGIPWEYTVPFKQARTFEAVIQAIKSVDGMMKRRTTEKDEVGENRKCK